MPGRLVLADALSYAVKDGLSPIIDVATLTGGIVVALGSVMSGMFCNDDLRKMGRTDLLFAFRHKGKIHRQFFSCSIIACNAARKADSGPF